MYLFNYKKRNHFKYIRVKNNNYLVSSKLLNSISSFHVFNKKNKRCR